METKPHTIEELKEWLTEMGHVDTVFFEEPDYISAIVGISEEGRLIYSYNLMVRHLMDSDGMELEEAIEYIDYNTIASLPYAGDMAPILMYELEL